MTPSRFRSINKTIRRIAWVVILATAVWLIYRLVPSQTLRELIRWSWLVVSIADCLTSGFSWLELRKKRDRSFFYISRIMLSDSYRALTSCVGLYLFGLNVQAYLWYIIWGLSSVVMQGYTTACFLFYWRGLINGNGIWDLLRRNPATPNPAEEKTDV